VTPRTFWIASTLLAARLAALPPTLPDLAGERVDVLARPGTRAVVLVFVGADCPISNRYAPELERLYQQFAARGAAFFLIYPDPGLDAEAARRHAKDYALSIPALLDRDHRMVAYAGVEVTPEAAVLGSDGSVLYRGRIDDRWVGFGTRRPRATRHDLQDALDAILAGRPAPLPGGRAVGCYIDPLSRGPAGQ
jgi:peroxiredoxin